MKQFLGIGSQTGLAFEFHVQFDKARSPVYMFQESSGSSSEDIMPTLTAAVPSSSPKPPRGVELRVWERFSCGLETSCQPLAARGDNDVCWSVRIKDVSAGGMGLVLTRRFERGTSLAIEIPA